jgi:hypothetical protein
MSDKHVEDSLDKIRIIFKKAQSRIDAIKPGEKIPATVLAEEIAKEHGMTGPQLYPTLKFLLDGYPNVDIRRGAHGGIFKLAPKVALTPAIVAQVEKDVEDILTDKELAPIINT